MFKNKKIKAKKEKSLGKKIFLIVLLIIMILIGLFAYRVHTNGGGLKGLIATMLGHNKNTVYKLDKLYCLVVGKSQNLTDTLILVSYDPKEQTAAMLSIPRDTFIGDNLNRANSWDKINAIYQTEDGPEKLLKEVRRITGLNVKYYLMIDTEALKVLVDEVGGVSFNVPIDMVYDDDGQNLHINLTAGEQLLDGNTAEQVVRFRHNNDGSTYPEEYGTEDIGRMRTQRDFLKALAKKLLTWNSVSKLTNLLDIANQYVETNLNTNKIKDYIPYAIDFKLENLKTEVLPGEPKYANVVWLYIPDLEETKEIVNNIFLNEKENTSNLSFEDKEKINIQILNGRQNQDRLDEIIERLEKEGYNIKDFTNASSVPTTTIINRNDVSNEIMQDIKNIVGEGVTLDGDFSENEDVTIILGRDI